MVFGNSGGVEPVEAEALDREVGSFDDLSLRVYRIQLEELSTPETWELGELTGLGGPGGSVLFSELWHDLVHPTDRVELSPIYQKIKQNHSTKWRVRFRWFANSTTILHIGTFDAQKRTVQGVLLDVTESKDLRANMVENERVATLGLLAGGVAHDINNLLCAILSFSKFAQDDMPVNSQSWRDINEVVKAAERAAGLTRQLLTFSKNREITMENVDLNERVGQLSTILSRLLGELVQVEVIPSSEPAVVRGDPIQFDQVILNLAVNARDAMLPKGGKLKISLERTDKEGSFIQLKVEDSGKGMDSETVSRIFEPFFTTKDPGHGTGLGLATCFSIVEKTDGRIQVQSVPGEGTTFLIEWPLVKDPKEREENTPKPPLSGKKSGAILVVEDDKSVRRVCDRILASAGYRVHTARDGKDALGVLKKHGRDIQLVLTDLVMPKVSGTELAETIEREYPHISVIFSSGYPEQGATLEESENTALWKPFQREDLLAAVGRVLSSKA
mgnify:CR=1 FL=1